MRRILTTAFAAVTLVAVPVSAQVAGLPVFNSGVSSGISLNADYGFLTVDPGSSKAKTIGLTGGVALGPLGVTATYASTNPEGAGDNQTWLGATANLKVFGGPLIPVSVNAQVGVGYNSTASAFPGVDVKTINVPVGIGFALNVPTPGLSIRPWIAPRMTYYRTSGDPLVNDSQTKFGISAGVNLGLIGGINGRIAYDQISFDNNVKNKVFSVGLGWNFNVPVVPGI